MEMVCRNPSPKSRPAIRPRFKAAFDRLKTTCLEIKINKPGILQAGRLFCGYSINDVRTKVAGKYRKQVARIRERGVAISRRPFSHRDVAHAKPDRRRRSGSGNDVSGNEVVSFVRKRHELQGVAYANTVQPQHEAREDLA